MAGIGGIRAIKARTRDKFACPIERLCLPLRRARERESWAISGFVARVCRFVLLRKTRIFIVKLTLFTTVDAQSGRKAELERLLQSVAPAAGEDGALLHLLLCQRASAEEAEAIANRFKFVEARAIPERVSLSHARNLLLFSPRARSAMGEEGIVGFPDDDAWYPAGFVDNLLAAFEKENASFFFCRYAATPLLSPTEIFSRVQTATLRDAVTYASSNTIFLRSAVARAVGAFDENLGIGTSIKSGEDTDYAIRAFRGASRAVWIDAPLVGHRDTNKALRSNYYAGDLLVVARYGRTSLAAFGLFLRKIAVGIYLAATRNLSFYDLMRALARAVGEFCRGHRQRPPAA